MRRIFRYARWCVSEQSGAPLPNDTSTAACVGFYKHLPRRRDNWPYFARWFAPEEFESLQSLFACHLDKKALDELRNQYLSDRRSVTM